MKLKELQCSIEQQKYFEQVEILRVIISSIFYYRGSFPESFEKRLSMAKKHIGVSKLNYLNLMDNAAWDFDSILAIIESYEGYELDLITEVNIMLEESFEELLNEYYSYYYALQGLKDWVAILDGRIRRNRSKFEYNLKEMKDSPSQFESSIASWIEEILSEIESLDYSYLLNLISQDSQNMKAVTLKLEQIPFSLSKYFDDNYSQQAESRLNHLQKQSFHPSKY
jgi:hypothetical protein